ncbi:hypothetical protein BS47DRAFT_1357305 [Hydnum rufescens UP504]|uniref:Uncharacterized protein n=1 Tax=Hydnum rufescens UP504 TaxID=1448309 RepID=A0A9P6DZE1_9AGAM|nr:hypothetical protein BS47DRAFT_1357305 [Hydnum rufescens UP504]
MVLSNIQTLDELSPKVIRSFFKGHPLLAVGPQLESKPQWSIDFLEDYFNDTSLGDSRHRMQTSTLQAILENVKETESRVLARLFYTHHLVPRSRTRLDILPQGFLHRTNTRGTPLLTIQCPLLISSIIQMDGFSMAISVQSGYMVFILADSTKRVVLKSSKWMSEQNMLERDLGWELVAVPAGMEKDATIPGALAHGSYLYSWECLINSLGAVWCQSLVTGVRVSARNSTAWMLLDQSLDLLEMQKLECTRSRDKEGIFLLNKVLTLMADVKSDFPDLLHSFAFYMQWFHLTALYEP